MFFLQEMGGICSRPTSGLFVLGFLHSSWRHCCYHLILATPSSRRVFSPELFENPPARLFAKPQKCCAQTSPPSSDQPDPITPATQFFPHHVRAKSSSHGRS